MAVEITFTLTDEHFGILSACFNRANPIEQTQEIIDDVPQFNPNGTKKMVDAYTDVEWLRKFAVECVKRKAIKGKNLLTLDGNPADVSLINTIIENL